MPEWIDRCYRAECPVGCEKCKLAKALAIAWEALESIKGSKADKYGIRYQPARDELRKDALDAMRRIEELGRDR